MSQAAFTAEEETDILRFLGYPDWQALASSVQLGYPATGQPLYLVRDSLKRVAPTAREVIRRYLCELRDIECQMSQARSRFRAKRLEGLELNPREPMMLRGEYTYWQRRLADDLGVVPNPYSQMEFRGMPGGLNATVG